MEVYVMSVTQTTPVQVQVFGSVPAGTAEFARAAVESQLRHVGEPVLFAHVLLAMAADPAVERPAIARVMVSVNGRLVRAQTADASMRDAVQHLRDRLRGRLGTAWPALRPDREARAAVLATAGGGHRPGHVPQERPPVIGRHSVAAGKETVEDAVAELELLDYDFHLFTELSTGQDSVVYRSGDGYRIAQPQPTTELTLPGGVMASEHAAPALSLDEAITRLETLGQPFAFFVDIGTGRGSIVYHRYDGHYGLVTPSVPSRSYS
jgi:Sigma 54 modulation/S30EA ribosomal protein C terminus